MTRHFSNWFSLVEDCYINRVQLRTLRNDSDVKDQLKNHLSIAACRNRDRMDVDSMLEISSNLVRNVISSKAEYITQTIIPEVYRVYDGNKKGVIGAPTGICKGNHGTMLVVDICGGAYSARLHYPVDVNEITTGLKTPLGIAYRNGVVYFSESAGGAIRVLDLQGKAIYNPNKLTAKDLRKILKQHDVPIPSRANKESLKKALLGWLEKEGDSCFREKQKHMQAINVSKPSALHIDGNGKKFFSD